jgi:hypothetical protein
VVRVPGYRTDMYCVSCEVRTQFICCVKESRPPLLSSGQSSWLQNAVVLCFLWGANWIYICYVEEGRLCGLVVRVLDYRSGGPGSILGTNKKKVVGQERGPLSLLSTTEELLDRKVAAPVEKTENTAGGNRHADHVAPSFRTSCQSLRRQAAVARSV